jgi:hypothetical protein
MKKIIALIAICLAFTVESNAQASVRWPAGSMQSVTAFTNTTKTTTMTPLTCSNTAVYAAITVDTSLVLRATINSGVKSGAILYVKVVNGATAATRVVTGSTGITMASYTMTSAKSHLFTFVYDGTNYLNTGVIKID